MPSKFVLWDIDGTLLITRQSSFRETMGRALNEVFGSSGLMADLQYTGMTDLEIILKAMESEGLTEAAMREKLASLSAVYLREMKERTNAATYERLPGVVEALEAIKARPDIAQTLVTGNIFAAARRKVELIGVADYLTLPGAYGEDGPERLHLPRLAIERLTAHFGQEIKPAQCVVIGDTVRDIACARASGCHVIAVHTGRGITAEELQAGKPDAFFADLSDTATVMATVDRLCE